MSPEKNLIEERISKLEKALKHLQAEQVETHENLNNEFSNRTEAQINVMNYIFRQGRAIRELIKSLAGKMELNEQQLEVLWRRAQEKAAKYKIQDEMLEDFEKGLGKEDAGN